MTVRLKNVHREYIYLTTLCVPSFSDHKPGVHQLTQFTRSSMIHTNTKQSNPDLKKTFIFCYCQYYASPVIIFCSVVVESKDLYPNPLSSEWYYNPLSS